MSVVTDSVVNRLYSVKQVRQLDQLAITDYQIPGYDLMRRAAAYAYTVLNHHWPEAQRILILCGSGNNAGDGYVLARLARHDNKQVTVVKLLDPGRLQGDAKTAYQDMSASGLEAAEFNSDMLNEADLVVDAIFGTGLDRAIGGYIEHVINVINASGLPVLALDVPSGLHADTGKIMNAAIKANITTSFIGQKRGLFTGDGQQCSGSVEFDSLELLAELYEKIGEPMAKKISMIDFAAGCRPRPKNSHKGHFGHVMVVGGDRGFLGAARMAAEAAARTGAGLVSIATRAAHAASIALCRPEIMSHGVETPNALMQLLQRASVIAIGPGLGQSDWARRLLASVLESGLPLVLDADALNLLAEEPQSSSTWILTPHPGEAARLLDTDTATIQADRFAAVMALQNKYGGTVILKGSGTLIADSNQEVFICDAGNPGMASGGMGDVLTGIIAALLAQKIQYSQAAQLAVCLHSTAADRAATGGERGLMAMDLMPHIRNLVNA